MMKKTKPSRPRGRPSKYPTHVKPKLAKIGAAVSRGASRIEIAKMCGVTVSALCDYANHFAELAECLQKSDAAACDIVIAAQFTRAIGYSHPAEKIITVADGNNQGSHVERVKYIEHYPPDPQAAKLFLSGKGGPEWRDKPHAGLADELKKAWDEFIAPVVDAKSELPGQVKEG